MARTSQLPSLMPASLITLAHSGVPFLMFAARSDGLLPTGSSPSSSNFLRTAGIARVLTVSPYSLSRTSFGVPAGASRPNHGTASKPGNPVSAMVGRSGASAERLIEVMASAQFPFARERHHIHDIGERHGDSVGEQVRHDRRGAAIGHWCNID